MASQTAVVVASSWFGDALLFIGKVFVIVVAGVVGFVVIVLIAAVAADWILGYARNTVLKQRGTVVPALFTFVGTLGVANAGATLPPAMNYALTAVVGMITFVSACLWQIRDRSKAARYIGLAGLLIPYPVAAIALITSGDLADLVAWEAILLGGSVALGVAGVISAIVLRDQFVLSQ